MGLRSENNFCVAKSVLSVASGEGTRTHCISSCATAEGAQKAQKESSKEAVCDMCHGQVHGIDEVRPSHLQGFLVTMGEKIMYCSVT